MGEDLAPQGCWDSSLPCPSQLRLSPGLPCDFPYTPLSLPWAPLSLGPLGASAPFPHPTVLGLPEEGGRVQAQRQIRLHHFLPV